MTKDELIELRQKVERAKEQRSKALSMAEARSSLLDKGTIINLTSVVEADIEARKALVALSKAEIAYNNALDEFANQDAL